MFLKDFSPSPFDSLSLISPATPLNSRSPPAAANRLGVTEYLIVDRLSAAAVSFLLRTHQSKRTTRAFTRCGISFIRGFSLQRFEMSPEQAPSPAPSTKDLKRIRARITHNRIGLREYSN
ncbi:hypothetical protein EVAR_2339_1 [Eumeta japonica]|uniref:Uncharacterized protein n=1 Tax=Eumeta variegata TaxID=151549 RepID=A0A4C1SIN5_EUMVA|nr:hypothetical protein EVAR_2339_1 [Eumeta japonica]